jgi:hypothetical protein
VAVVNSWVFSSFSIMANIESRTFTANVIKSPVKKRGNG